MALTERWRALWDEISRGPARVPARVAIPRAQVAWAQDTPSKTFLPDEHYFLVRVNELYLTYGRKWFAKYDPMVLVVSEFTYDKQEQAVPFVVGPTLLDGRGQEAPAGMVFSDTRVAGIHPYRGGRLTLSVVLSRVERDNYARKFLELVEGAAGVVDFSIALGAYVQVANVVLDGVRALFGMDGAAQPLLGYRKEFEPEAGDVLDPGYFALIDASDDELDLDRLWVRGNRLHLGDSLEDSKPFRAADFVLFSILQTEERQDVRTLPFYPLFERVQEGATSRDEADWKRAKADMASLWQDLILSPDLTDPQAKALANRYRSKLQELLEEAKEMSTLGPGDRDGNGSLSTLREAGDILEL